MKSVLVFVAASLCTLNLLALNLAPIKKNIQIEQKASYSYELPLNLFITTEQMGSLNRLINDLNYAQKRFDKCGVKLRVSELLEIKSANWLNQWESFWFGGGSDLTNWEKSFFAGNNLEHVNILLVENLNWTVNGQGTWGVGYGQILIDELKSDQEKEFFVQHGLGNIVIGNYRATSTLAHEIGHAAFDLMHTYESKNLMSNYHSFEPIEFIDGVAQIPTDLEFSKEQCDAGIKNSIFIKPIFLNIETLADSIGNGVVTLNGQTIDNDACVMRFLYENKEYRVEYDYMGIVDIEGLDRFDLGKSQMLSPNRFEMPLHLKSDSKLAQKICGNQSSFSGKKIISSTDVETSEIRIEGFCSADQTRNLKMMSLNCKIK